MQDEVNSQLGNIWQVVDDLKSKIIQIEEQLENGIIPSQTPQDISDNS